jgi:hypothetical protein
MDWTEPILLEREYATEMMAGEFSFGWVFLDRPMILASGRALSRCPGGGAARHRLPMVWTAFRR